MTFEKFKEMYDFPRETMYEELWMQMLKEVNKNKYGKFRYETEIAKKPTMVKQPKKKGRKSKKEIEMEEEMQKEAQKEINLEQEEAAKTFTMEEIVNDKVEQAFQRARDEFSERRQQEIEEALQAAREEEEEEEEQ